MAMVYLAQTNEIPTGTMKSFNIQGKNILVANLAGKYYAIGGKCTHAGGDLSKGQLDGEAVICPRHHSKFDLKTGKRLAGPAKKDEPAYEVNIEDININIMV